MKLLFTVFLVLNLLAETLAAVGLIGADTGLAAALAGAGKSADSAGLWSMHYGFAVISIASAIAWIWPHRSSLKVVTVVLGMLMTFHVALLTSLAAEGTQGAGIVIHSVLALLAVVLFVSRSRWCDQD